MTGQILILPEVREGLAVMEVQGEMEETGVTVATVETEPVEVMRGRL